MVKGKVKNIYLFSGVQCSFDRNFSKDNMGLCLFTFVLICLFICLFKCQGPLLFLIFEFLLHIWMVYSHST